MPRNDLVAYAVASSVLFTMLAVAGYLQARALWPWQATLALASLALAAFAFASPAHARGRALARGLGTLLLCVGALALFSPTLFGYPARAGLSLRVGAWENATHLAMGAWGVLVGTRRTN